MRRRRGSGSPHKPRGIPESYVHDLGREFRRLASAGQPQKRGYAFEDLVAELFRRNGFAVRKSPPSTRPRQTDVLARDRDLTILVSAKWLKRQVSTAEIDAVLTRLKKLSPRPLGCLFSVSGYTGEVAQYAADQRDEAEILVFSQHEIELLFDGAYPIADLIEDKRSALRERGTMAFRMGRPPPDRTVGVDLPDAAASFQIGSTTAPVIAVHGYGHDFVYGYRMSMSTWGYYGKGARLNLHLPFSSLGELSTFLHMLPATIGMSSDGMFAIHQNATSWHGFSMKALLQACGAQKSRYESAVGELHHREHCIYFGDVRDGWMILTFQLDSSGGESIAYAELEIRIPGVPTDMKPYESLSRALGYRTFFEPVVDHDPEVRWTSFGEQGPRLEVRHLITQDDGRTIRGLVAKNPFNGGSTRTGSEHGEVRALLRGPENVVCTVTDMIDPETKVDYFYVTEVARIPMAVRQPVEIKCTWHRLVDPPRAPEDRGADWAADLTAAARQVVKEQKRRRRDRWRLS